eukprot:178061-Alexandrium_andersonii.AAC.1
MGHWSCQHLGERVASPAPHSNPLAPAAFEHVIRRSAEVLVSVAFRPQRALPKGTAKQKRWCMFFVWLRACMALAGCVPLASSSLRRCGLAKTLLLAQAS